MKARTAENSNKTPKKRRRKWIILLSILALLVIIRLILPYFVLKYVNKQLSQMKEYYGHVEDIDLHLYRGAYVIKDIWIKKIEQKGQKVVDTIPFFKSQKIDLSVEWKALFKGKIVGEIEFQKPVINFVKGAHKNEDVKADTADFRELINDLMPLTVNRFQIEDGEIHYIDKTSDPHINIFMQNIDAVASNLSNEPHEGNLLPANLQATANVYQGTVKLDVKFDALAKQPTFDLNAEMKNLNLTALNPMLQAYGNFDVNKGTFSVYTEFAGKNGNFNGYIKPLIKDLDVVKWTKDEGSFIQILWESVVGTAAEIFENQPKDQLATKVELNGKFTNPNINIWKAISYVLRNAFVQAIRPTLDQTININKGINTKDKTLLEKVFGSGKATKKDKKSERKERRKERRKNR